VKKFLKIDDDFKKPNGIQTVWISVDFVLRRFISRRRRDVVSFRRRRQRRRQRRVDKRTFATAGIVVLYAAPFEKP
jgi:hypothetical protein